MPAEKSQSRVEWLRLNPPDEPISLDAVKVLAKHGRPKKGSNTTFSGGRGRTYILARLDRDGFAELAAKVRAREISANAAAIEAGWRCKPSAFDQIKRLILNADLSETSAANSSPF